MLKVVQENNESNRDEPNGAGVSLLDEIVRDGARQMLTAALQAAVGFPRLLTRWRSACHGRFRRRIHAPALLEGRGRVPGWASATVRAPGCWRTQRLGRRG